MTKLSFMFSTTDTGSQCENIRVSNSFKIILTSQRSSYIKGSVLIILLNSYGLV